MINKLKQFLIFSSLSVCANNLDVKYMCDLPAGEYELKAVWTTDDMPQAMLAAQDAVTRHPDIDSKGSRVEALKKSLKFSSSAKIALIFTDNIPKTRTAIGEYFTTFPTGLIGNGNNPQLHFYLNDEIKFSTPFNEKGCVAVGFAIATGEVGIYQVLGSIEEGIKNNPLCPKSQSEESNAQSNQANSSTNSNGGGGGGSMAGAVL